MKSNIEWEKWGERDPLYAVATWQGKERGSPNAWTDADFYELGHSDWADFLRHWQHYGLKAGTCIEIGCGAGRITKQLSQYFQHVTGLDVSQHQLDYARDHISASNVTLTISDGTRLPVADRACDALFSVQVFQHFESHHDAFSVFREIHRALIDGGTLMIQLPLYNLPDTKVSIIFEPIISLAKRLSDLKAAINRRQLLKGRWKPMMRRLRFDRQQLLHNLQDIGFSRIEFRMFAAQSNHSYHEFVFATKAPNHEIQDVRPFIPKRDLTNVIIERDLGFMFRLKQVLRNCVLSAVRLFGSEITDHATGTHLGKVLFFPWRGKIYVIGLQAAVRPMFLPQDRLTYWKQAIGFTVHPRPDFSREKDAGR